MKNKSIASVFGVLGLIAAVGAAGIAGGFGTTSAAPAKAPANAATQFQIDGTHSSLIYRISHLGVSNFYGRFDTVEGDFTFDKAAPESSSLNVTVKSDTIDSNNPQRDGHLKGPDFFNVKQFPTITFKSTGVKKVGDSLELTGELTLLGQTKPVTAKLVNVGEKDAGPKFGYRCGLEAMFTIKRSDFGMKYMAEGGMLGDDVQVIVALEGVRK